MAIYVDGACSGNGAPNARAGIGVFVCCNSDLNISALIDGPQTNQRAEIRAATAALKHVRQFFLDGEFRGPRRPRGVVLITDSSYLANAMTDWVYKWSQNGWRTSTGRPVVNADDFMELDGLLRYLEDHRVPVRFWLVARKFNVLADELAKKAIGL